MNPALKRLSTLVLAAMVGGLTAMTGAVPVAASSSTTSTVADEFGAGSWKVAAGAATLSTTGTSTSGGSALHVAYNVSAGSLNLAPTATRPDLPGLPRTVSIDVNGDGSWNVLYLQLRDATGEIFHYKLGNVSFRGWQTLSVDPGRTAPAATMSGDGDGIIDLPIQTYRIVLDHNGTQPSSSSIDLDRLTVVSETWSPLRSDSKVFVPSAGQATNVRLGLADPATFGVVLTDEAGRTRTWSGTAAGGSVESAFRWDGKSDGAVLMTGSIRARLTITRGSAVTRFDVPYLSGLAARLEYASPGSIVGINSTMTTINTVDRGKVENQARLMEGAFVRMARESFDWNRVEPSKGSFDWAKFDQAVEVAGAHQISILGMLGYSALWASSAPSGASSPGMYPPKVVADYATYVRAVVHRYKDRVHYWEIWNEENSATFWKSGVSASAYAALLKAAYAAIKAEDPTATVLMGGTVGFDKSFMDGLVAAGAWSSFDALAIHTYVAGQPETSMIVPWLDNARAYVDSKGTKPIWVTEFGWSTYQGSGSGYIGVTETHQAEYTARSYLHAAEVGVRGMFLYSLLEYGTSTTSLLDNYGIVQGDGRQKPAYAALRRVAESLDGATSAGVADPNVGSRTTVGSLDVTTGFKVAPLGGGSASLATTTSRHGGAAALKVTYAFTSSSTGLELSRNLPVAGRPTSVSVWVYGDGSANPVYLKIADATGETFQGVIGSLGSGWKRMTLHMDGGDTNWKASGGDGDHVIDYPITIRSIFVYRGGIGRLSGSAIFDDLQVETGTPVRGVDLSRRGAVDEALYTMSGAPTIKAPVTGPNAYQVDGSAATTLAINAGTVSVKLGTMPINVLSYPSGSTGPAAIHWVSGDRTMYTFQVFSSGGALLRTISTGNAADAGVRTASWDGTISGVPAAAGTYRLRVAVFGPDGRVSYLQKDVTLP